jgi:hypothetical protein
LIYNHIHVEQVRQIPGIVEALDLKGSETVRLP